MVCKIFFCSEFTVRISRYSGKKVEKRRRREVITKRCFSVKRKERRCFVLDQIQMFHLQSYYLILFCACGTLLNMSWGYYVINDKGTLVIQITKITKFLFLKAKKISWLFEETKNNLIKNRVLGRLPPMKIASIWQNIFENQVFQRKIPLIRAEFYEMDFMKYIAIHSFFYKNNFIRTRASSLTKS